MHQFFRNLCESTIFLVYFPWCSCSSSGARTNPSPTRALTSTHALHCSSGQGRSYLHRSAHTAPPSAAGLCSPCPAPPELHFSLPPAPRPPPPSRGSPLDRCSTRPCFRSSRAKHQRPRPPLSASQFRPRTPRCRSSAGPARAARANCCSCRRPSHANAATTRAHQLQSAKSLTARMLITNLHSGQAAPLIP
jgi:hypothetical protein